MSTTEERPLDEIIAEGAPAPADKPEQAPSQAQQTIDTSPQPEPQGNWTYAALKDERSKRQRAQEEVAELKQQLAAHEPAPTEDFWTNPDAQISRIEMAARAATLRASQAEVVAEHGREVFNEIEAGIRHAMETNHPDLPILRDAMLASDHPVIVAAHWVAAQQRGASQRSTPQRAPAYPSNLASTRSAGPRRGPAWGGPTPLNDIFDRGRT